MTGGGRPTAVIHIFMQMILSTLFFITENNEREKFIFEKSVKEKSVLIRNFQISLTHFKESDHTHTFFRDIHFHENFREIDFT